MKAIAGALVNAQKAFGPALKTSTNPHFRSKYADLSAVVEAVIDHLNANGIFLSQKCHESDSGVVVETIFIHESGEEYSCGKLHVPAQKQDPQGYGSALTYARRYALMAACGIAPEDDDGNAATKAVQERPVVAQSFRSSPTMGIFETLSQERQSVVLDVVDAVNQKMAANDVCGAYEEAAGLTDSEEKTALWGKLDSKTRRALTSYKESLNEKEAA